MLESILVASGSLVLLQVRGGVTVSQDLDSWSRMKEKWIGRSMGGLVHLQWCRRYWFVVVKRKIYRSILVHPFIYSRDLSMVNQRTRSRTWVTEMSFLCRVSGSLDKWKIMAGWRARVCCTSIWEVGEVKRPFLNYLKCNILQQGRLFKCANWSFQASTSQHTHHENRLHTTGWLNSNVTPRSVTTLHDGWIRK